MWIHVPPTYLASAQDSGALSSELKQPWLEELLRSATLRTKSVSLQSLRRVWKTVPSIQRLSGLTCAPSIQNLGVEKWISSLEDSHASHTQSRETSSEKTTQENSAEKSSELQPDLDTQLSFLKMSPASSDSTGTPYDPNYERWVTQLRKDSSQRQRQAHHISESDSLSWRTPASQESGIRPERLEGELGSRMYDKETGRNAQYGLSQQVWMTPNTMDSLAPKSQEALDYEHDTARQGRSNPNNLRDQAAVQEGITNWPTPRSTEYKNPDQPISRREDTPPPHLSAMAKNWPTPNANEDRAENYTPETSQRHLDEGRQVHLAQVAKLNWPTPTTRDHKDGTSAETVPENALLGRAAPNWENSRSIPQAPATTKDGLGSSTDGPSLPQPSAKNHRCSTKCRRLNANFAAHLMGLPKNYLLKSCCVESAMGWFRLWQHSLSENLARL